VISQAEGTLLIRSDVDDAERALSFVAVPSYPFIISVGVSTADARIGLEDDRRADFLYCVRVSITIAVAPPDGRVRCIAREEGDGVVVEVSDSGVGMTEAEIETALTSFGKSITRSRVGITAPAWGCPWWTFIELLGGSLEIRSQTGKGASVRLRLAVAGPSPMSVSSTLPHRQCRH
jgi:hypothetical protein